MVQVDLKSPSPSERITKKACKRFITVPNQSPKLILFPFSVTTLILHSACKTLNHNFESK